VLKLLQRVQLKSKAELFSCVLLFNVAICKDIKKSNQGQPVICKADIVRDEV